MTDLLQRLARIVDQHHQADEYGYDTEECRCGDDNDGTQTWAEHLAKVLTDELLDLAGTGQLLASLSQVGRVDTPRGAANACEQAERGA